MDYEKKYNKALERAKYYHDRDNIQFLENIFPELKESEDERIRKSLIDMLKNDEKCYLKEIAWLEKKGKSYWSEKDERYSKDLADYFTGGFSLNHIEDDIVDWLKSIKERMT